MTMEGEIRFNERLTAKQLNELTNVLADEFYAENVPATLTSPRWYGTPWGLQLRPDASDHLNEAVEWLKFLIAKFFKPWNVLLNGYIGIVKNKNIAQLSNLAFIKVVNNKIISSEYNSPSSYMADLDLKIESERLKDENRQMVQKLENFRGINYDPTLDPNVSIQAEHELLMLQNRLLKRELELDNIYRQRRFIHFMYNKR